MEIADFLKIVFSAVLVKLPMLVVLIAAIIYCIINSSKNPPVSRRALSGLTIVFVVEILGVLMPLVPIFLLDKSGSINSTAYLTMILVFLLSTGSAVGLSLILWAIWTNRNA